jgi:hypothetical protein
MNSMLLNSKKIFLVDCSGALLSAFLLGVVLVKFESAFGMPREIVYFLSFIACIFAAYSFTNYLVAKEKWRANLKLIAYANLLYCALTLSLVFYYKETLTDLGLIYFVCEAGIILTLATLELKTAFKIIEKINK